MKQIGLYLFIGGVGSILLNQFGYEFILLGWIDNWGTDIGWGIRGVAIVAGAVFYGLGVKQESADSAENPADTE
ncbi:MAG: hypothetical protein ACI93R_003739 [Flavobacteriales bacterium]|jgi:hypothetical protein